jgi:hypothetical protein
MKNSKSKRSPLVRFFRGVVRLFKVLLKPKRKNLKSADDYQHELRAAELERRNREAQERIAREAEELQREQLITVGALFARVKWQDSPSTTLDAKPLDMGMTTRSRDVSLN